MRYVVCSSIRQIMHTPRNGAPAGLDATLLLNHVRMTEAMAIIRRRGRECTVIHVQFLIKKRFTAPERLTHVCFQSSRPTRPGRRTL